MKSELVDLPCRRVDRVIRAQPDLLQERGAEFRSLTEQIDTITSGEKWIFRVFGALAKFDHGLIQKRTNATLWTGTESNS